GGQERGAGRTAGLWWDRESAGTSDMDVRYRYDAAGNLLSIADTPVGGARDIQCFRYDELRRLSRAWSTANAGADPCVGGPEAGVGGPAPYHHSWTFDA